MKNEYDKKISIISKSEILQAAYKSSFYIIFTSAKRKNNNVDRIVDNRGVSVEGGAMVLLFKLNLTRY